MRSWVLALLCAASGSAPPGCSCDCCSVVQTDGGLRCTRAAAADPHYADQPACGDTCAVNLTHSVLTPKVRRTLSRRQRETGEVDVENFCFHDCAPRAEDAAELCAPGFATLSKAPAPAPRPAPKHALLRRAAATAVAGRQQRSDGGEDVAAASRSEDWAKGAAERLALATQSKEVATGVASSAERAAAFVGKAVVAAQRSADGAARYEDAAHRINEMVQPGARESAGTVYDDTIKDVVAAAHKVAEKEAKAAAAKLEKEMKAAAPKAGQDAMKPYIEAQGKAGADAAAWAKQGDAASGLAFQMSLAAGMTMAQANQWNALGDFGRAQSMLRQSMETTNMALGIAGAAQNAYDTSAGIVSHLLDYVPMMGAAQYHAEYMLNPDMPPPAAFGR